jgi:bifunctional non-homologous end joining protein LigD
MLWDRGTFDLLGTGDAEQQIARGDLKLRLHGEKVRGEFALVLMKGRGKGNEWLLIKKRDEFADPDWDIEDHAFSVKTGRTQEEIARNLETPAREKAKSSVLKTLPDSKQKAPMPQSVTPMTAQSADKPPRGGDWIYEINGMASAPFALSRTGTCESFRAPASPMIVNTRNSPSCRTTSQRRQQSSMARSPF